MEIAVVIDGWRTKILDECPGLVLLSRGVLLIGVGCLEYAIAQIEVRGLVILGMDGFRTDGVALAPQLDFIADFGEIDGSWSERTRQSCQSARLIAAAWNNGTEFVEFILDEPGL